ncbi:MAG TPA: protein tyrosine phosphatase family protein [Chthonomonadaceae bacterium]|nr:protein tyrosine phosphatase family protein [Chthonomonadaceae bacterium]
MPETDESLQKITGFLRLSERIGTAGQPTAAQFPAIKAAGYEVVINLLPHSELLPNEAEVAQAQGLEYTHIPVIWTSPTLDDFARFVQAMEANADRRVFIHCAANKRVSAFMYLYRILRENASPEDAARDLHRLWTPNPIWQEFIAHVLAHYQGSGS